MNMVESLARSVAARSFKDQTGGVATMPHAKTLWPQYVNSAEQILHIMREPSATMVEAGIMSIIDIPADDRDNARDLRTAYIAMMKAAVADWTDL